MYTYWSYDNDITNQLLNALPCNMHVVHPWCECYPRLTPRVTFAPRVNTRGSIAPVCHGTPLGFSSQGVLAMWKTWRNGGCQSEISGKVSKFT